MIPVLAIGGSDPSGGAGVQLDLKVLAAHGVWGMAAITAHTVQTPRRVSRVAPVPPELLADQLAALFEDQPPAAVKVGMLGTAAHVAVVAEALAGRGLPLVVDPVRRATLGATLLDDAAREALIGRLLPLATLVTPNAAEADWLGTGLDGVPTLVTGGDLPGDAVVDRLTWGGGARDLRGPRHPVGAVHGTGCALSSAIAAGLARGLPLEAAVEGAIGWVRAAIGASWTAGGGRLLGF